MFGVPGILRAAGGSDVNRDELDAFFAKADDVLTDWTGSEDAMHARTEDEDADLPLADSYYHQLAPWLNPRSWIWHRRAEQPDPGVITFDITIDTTTWDHAMQRLAVVFDETRTWARQRHEREQTAFERALNYRRNRNTGPADSRGLDGRYRRRGALREASGG